MTGINRETGKPLAGFPHVQQSLRVLFSTRLRSRIMRRLVGSDVPALLGQNASASTVLKFATAIITATELWEPRVKISRVSFDAVLNTPETARLGGLTMRIEGRYRPNALQGDFTPEGDVSFVL